MREHHAHEGAAKDSDDLERFVPNRAEKRRLLKKLRRLPAGRTGRPWPFVRKTGTPDIYRQIFLAQLRAHGINVKESA